MTYDFHGSISLEIIEPSDKIHLSNSDDSGILNLTS
jgi:hypothetical protein